MSDASLPKPTQPTQQQPVPAGQTTQVVKQPAQVAAQPSGGQAPPKPPTSPSPVNKPAQAPANQNPVQPKANPAPNPQTPPQAAPSGQAKPAQSAPQASSAVQPATQQPAAKPQMPPTTLTALSSMSSTHVPPASQQPAPPSQQLPGGPGTRATASPAAPPPPKAPGEKQVATPPPQAGQPPVAKPKRSFLRIIPFILGGLALLGVLVVVAMRLLGGSATDTTDTNTTDGTNKPQRTTVPTQQVTIQYWGLWEPSEVLTTVIKEYEASHPGVTISYTKQAHQNYRERLQTAISSGTGPDIFRFHASWVPMIGAELAPIPSTVMGANDFKSAYYPVVSQQLQYNSQFVGIPLMYDGLALLYNKDILDTAGAQPPTTWSELGALASRLTVRSGATVQRAGIALGNAANVEHFSDILAVLMMQNGADFANPNSPEVRDALLFYTKFVRTDQIWNATLPPSTVAFARGDAAMVFAPSWRIHEIQARNPNLKIGVVSLPKLSDERITWATYWAEGVNNRGKQKEATFEFLKYLSSKEVLQKLYSEQSKVRGFGELYPRVDMADLVADNEMVSPFLKDAPYAQGWYMSSFTHDNGINDQIIKYYEDAITAVSDGKSVEDALEILDQGVKQVLRQYGISTKSTTQPAQTK
ncbi:extracellular solute-binding protein [Candidatus Woesebacteria bacterium]|nr:extracellular solute-binding protein [Candidatus Woesebacteria bacterium]